MKKKIISFISLILAVIMVLPIGVFAAEPAIEADKYHDGGSTIVVYDGGMKRTVKLSVPGETVINWAVQKEGQGYIQIDGTGTVTAKTLSTDEAKTAMVIATLDSGKAVTATVTVKKYKVTKIEIDETRTQKDYVVGQTITKSNIKVDATYTDGSKFENFTDYTIEPSTALTTSNDKLVVTYSKDTNLKDEVAINVAKVNLTDFVQSIAISAPVGKEYAVGEILKPSDIQIKITNVGTSAPTYATAAQNSDIKVTIKIGDTAKTWTADGYTFSTNDVTSDTNKCIVTVEYAGKSDSIELTVKTKGTTPSTPTNTKYTATMTTPPIKKSYVVGDKFDITGAKFTIKYNGVEISATNLSNFTIDYKFTATDIGKTAVEFDLVFIHNGVYTSAKVVISGLTVAAQATYVDEYPTQILSVELKRDKYPVGYTFSLKDIDSVWARFKAANSSSSSYGQLKTVTYEELIKFTAYLNDEIDLEVLDADGDRKSSLRCHKLQEADVVDGEAKLVFIFGDEEYEVDIEVGDPDVSFYYEDTLIKDYDSIEDALDFTVEQDPTVDKTIFDLSKVLSAEELTIKLGRDFKFSNSFEFNPRHNVVIDLAGHELTMDSDQIEVLRANRYMTVTITNTADEEATLIYDDEEITIVLDMGESVEFTYGGEAPGIYEITINKVNNGKVAADHEIDDSVIKVGLGDKVKFTITPNTGYVIDSLKVDSKVVAEKNYTVASNGTVTYTLEDVQDDMDITVTFKKGTAADDWTNPFTNGKTNPFTDVSKTATYYTAVRFVYTNGLFQGTETNKFEPNTTMTRAMFVTVLGRLAEASGIKVTRYTNSSYTDVVVNKDTNWYTPYVEWATRNGIVEGHGDGTFGPDDEITHEQMYTMMYRYAMHVAQKSVGSVSNVSLNTISDRSSISDWALNAVKYAQKNDFIVYSSGTRIAPQGDAKRSELAMLLEKYCESVLGWEMQK